MAASHGLQVRTTCFCQKRGTLPSSCWTMHASRCETYVRVLLSWLPNPNFELGFLNTFSQLIACNLNDVCACRSRQLLPPCCVPTCPRTLLKEEIQWNPEEFYLTASQCPKVRRQVRVKRMNFSRLGLQSK